MGKFVIWMLEHDSLLIAIPAVLTLTILSVVYFFTTIFALIMYPITGVLMVSVPIAGFLLIALNVYEREGKDQ